MKYVVVVTEANGELRMRVFANIGGGWLDAESAKVWAEDYASIHHVDYEVIALEYPV